MRLEKSWEERVMKNKMKIAIYLRLSKEDEWITQESNSISCQRLLLKGYIERNFEKIGRAHV